jgi:hypothetical protein
MEQSEAPPERTPAPEQRRGFLGRLFGRNSAEPPVQQHIRTMDGPVSQLLEERVQAAPESEGIIALWEGSTLIYLGAAQQNLGGIRAELQAKRSAGGCTQSATHFQYEIASNSASLLQDLLSEHRLQHGSLPRCNQ